MIDKKTKIVLSLVILISAINYYLYKKDMKELKDIIKNK